MDEFRAREAREFHKDRVTILSAADAGAQFHEFVVLEGEAKFVPNAGREAVPADEHDRMQRVTEPPEVFFLPLAERHRRIIGL